MKTLKGRGVSRGLACGAAFIYRPAEYEPRESYFPKGLISEKLSEWRGARDAAAKELDALIGALSDVDAEKASIFTAQKEILLDEEIEGLVDDAIEKKRAMPDYAVSLAFDEFILLVEKSGDALIAERADDLRDVRRRLIRNLWGEEDRSLGSLLRPAVIVARDLFPSDTVLLNKEKTLGIITERGSDTSHTAIIARSLEIPAAVGVYGATDIIKEGETVIIDGDTGAVSASPDDQARESFSEKKKLFDGLHAAEIQAGAGDARLKDGTRIEIGLNVGAPSDIKYAPLSDFAGLIRTEFLFMNAESAPCEEEQYAVYSTVLRGFHEKSATLRLLDVGGDKSLRYLTSVKEDNPFLGRRGVRLLFDNEPIFKTQLRAALRAGASAKLRIMVPMVSDVEDIRRARSIFEEVKRELVQENAAFCEKAELGIMIETPSIALLADAAAREADFASIGTNDLCGYLFAADRTNPAVSGYEKSLSPAMLRLISSAVGAFDKAGKEISVCGELASEPMGAVLLAGLGLRRLSMSGANIGRIKLLFSKITLTDATKAAHEALTLSTQGEVEALMRSNFKEI